MATAPLSVARTHDSYRRCHWSPSVTLGWHYSAGGEHPGRDTATSSAQKWSGVISAVSHSKIQPLGDGASL